jgi:ATP-dependent helicase HepA
VVTKIQDLVNAIKIERYFDVSGYEYFQLNRLVDDSIESFNQSETKWFAQAIKGWAQIVGFNYSVDKQDPNTLTFNASSFSVESAKRTLFLPPDMKRVIEDKQNQMQNRIRLLNGEKEQTGLNYIRGSCSRSVATGNDYLHFFAPGDEIFDSIVDNALSLYRGQTAAVNVSGGQIKWLGFVFLWTVTIDEGKIFEMHLNKRLVDQYKCFLPLRKKFDCISYPGTEESEQNLVLTEYLRFINHYGLLKNQECIINLGSRNDGEISKFKQIFKEAAWQKALNEAVIDSKNKTLAFIKPKFDEGIIKVREEIGRIIASNHASDNYFKINSELSELEATQKQILYALSEPKLELNSICFFNVTKNGH